MRNAPPPEPSEAEDPADRPEPTMTDAMDVAGVPHQKRAHNAGGDMSETTRSRRGARKRAKTSDDIDERDPHGR